MTKKEGSSFSGLDLLASVCCFLDDHEKYYSDTVEEPILDLVESLKFSHPIHNFPKTLRRRQQKMMIITGTGHLSPKEEDQLLDLDISALPRPKKRRRDDDRKPLQILKKCRLSALPEAGHGHQNKGKKVAKTSTAGPKRTAGPKKAMGKKASDRKTVRAGPVPPPVLSINFKEKIIKEVGHYSDLRLLIQKSLTKTDLEEGQNRISIPIKQIESVDFLTQEEKTILATRKKDNHLEGIEVDLIEPDLRNPKSKMMLKKWDYPKSKCSSLMLSHKWYDVVDRNKLKKEEVVQIWFFRSRQRNSPCFAAVNLGHQETDSSSNSSSPTSVVTA